MVDDVTPHYADPMRCNALHTPCASIALHYHPIHNEAPEMNTCHKAQCRRCNNRNRTFGCEWSAEPRRHPNIAHLLFIYTRRLNIDHPPAYLRLVWLLIGRSKTGTWNTEAKSSFHWKCNHPYQGSTAWPVRLPPTVCIRRWSHLYSGIIPGLSEITLM